MFLREGNEKVKSDKLSKNQKTAIISAVSGLVLLIVVSVIAVYMHSKPADSSLSSGTGTESVTELVTESSSETETESTTESTTEKVTKPPAAPVTKVYIPKKKPAPAPQKTVTKNKKVILNVPIVKQNPKYPTGCEGASATMLLKYHGYNVTIDEMMAAIPRDDLYKENGKVYGPSIYEKFVGDPSKTHTDDRPGYGAFAPVITKALNQVILGKGNRHTAKNITGCTFNTLLSYLDKKSPVIVWATDNMKTPTLVNSWYIKNPDGSDRYFEYPRGTHVMVLSGYDGKYVYITDPYYGKVKYTYSAFHDKWVLLGRQAIVLNSGAIPVEPATEKSTFSTTERVVSTTDERNESTTQGRFEFTTHGRFEFTTTERTTVVTTESTATKTTESTTAERTTAATTESTTTETIESTTAETAESTA